MPTLKVVHLNLYSEVKINLRKIQIVNQIIIIESPISANFEDLALCLITNYKNFPGGCSILAKNLTDFDPPNYELNNLTDTTTQLKLQSGVQLLRQREQAWQH